MAFIILQLHATKKAGGSTKNGRDSVAKRLGVKVYGSQWINAGGIIIRQRGASVKAGENTYMGKDYTIHAKVSGLVEFAEIADGRKEARVKEVKEKAKK